MAQNKVAVSAFSEAAAKMGVGAGGTPSISGTALEKTQGRISSIRLRGGDDAEQTRKARARAFGRSGPTARLVSGRDLRSLLGLTSFLTPGVAMRLLVEALTGAAIALAFVTVIWALAMAAA